MIAAVVCADERYRKAMEYNARTARKKGGADRVYQYLVSDIDEEFREIVGTSEFIDEKRRDRLCVALKGRVDSLQRMMDASVSYAVVDDLSMDVKEDIAYHGK